MWSTNWKASKNVAKQRKYRSNAPTHIKRKMCSVHLSKDLREKHGKRSVVVVTGDKVKVLRGQHKGHVGKVESVSTAYEQVRIAGIEISKKTDQRQNIIFIHQTLSSQN